MASERTVKGFTVASLVQRIRNGERVEICHRFRCVMDTDGIHGYRIVSNQNINQLRCYQSFWLELMPSGALVAVEPRGLITSASEVLASFRDEVENGSIVIGDYECYTLERGEDDRE